MDADVHRLSAVALTSSQPQDILEGSINPEMDMMTPEKLQEIIWFFRTEDPSTWNYCILALSLAVLLLGIILLAINVTANRNRKAILLHSEGYKDAQSVETEMKQAFVTLKGDGHSEAATEDLLPKVQNAGEADPGDDLELQLISRQRSVTLEKMAALEDGLYSVIPC